MADGKVIVPPDNTGKSIATQELTRADGVTVVERQEVVIADPTNVATMASVSSQGLSVVEKNDVMLALITDIYRELRSIRIGISQMAQTGLDPNEFDI